MKRFIFLLAVASLSVSLFAQVRFGVATGLNVSNMIMTDSSTDPVVGMHVGVLVDCPVAPNCYFQPSLLFAQSGVKTEENQGTLALESKIKLNYIKMPLALSYRYPINDKFTFDINAGLYMAFGVSGKTTVKLSDEDQSYTVTSSDGLFDQNKEQKEQGVGSVFKRFDAGTRIGVGTHFCQHFAFAVNYDLGFINNLNKEGYAMKAADALNEKLSSKNSSLQFSVSFTY